MHHDGIAYLIRAARPAMTATLIVETGLDELIPATLVHRLYDKVRADPMLGPIAAARVTDCEPHLARIVDFRATVALNTGRGYGLPVTKQSYLPVTGRQASCVGNRRSSPGCSAPIGVPPLNSRAC